jgi:hypothetical protein
MSESNQFAALVCALIGLLTFLAANPVGWL